MKPETKAFLIGFISSLVAVTAVVIADKFGVFDKVTQLRAGKTAVEGG